MIKKYYLLKGGNIFPLLGYELDHQIYLNTHINYIFNIVNNDDDLSNYKYNPITNTWLIIKKAFDYTTLKTFDDVLKRLKMDKAIILGYSNCYLSNDVLAYNKLKLVVTAINDGWTPNWSDQNQKKWYPYFSLIFDFEFTNSAYSYTAINSKLCFESREKSDYCATQFIDLYKQFML